MVEAGSVRRLLHVEAVVEDADDVVGDGGDDGRSAGRAEDQQRLAGLALQAGAGTARPAGR